MSIPTPPRWRALAAFAFLNFLAGIFLLSYFARASVLVKGFGAGLFFLGVSQLGWLISSGLFWKQDPVGISLLKIVAAVNAGLCILLRALLSSDFGAVYASAYLTSPNPGALANQWSESMGWLTLLCFVNASTTAYLFFRFRQPITIPRVGFYLRSALVLFRPSYKGPRRWLMVTIWSCSIPSYLSLLSVLGLYGLAYLTIFLRTTPGSMGRLFYYLSIVVWWFSIPCATLATLGALTFAFSHGLPSETKWSAFAFVAAAWVSTALGYLLFAKM